MLERVTAEGDLVLQDRRILRLAGLHLVTPAAAPWPKPGQALAVGLLGETPDRWGRRAALVFLASERDAGAWLQQGALEAGAALARPEADLGACWPLILKAEAAAEAGLPAPPVEGGRFARAAGRVMRVGEGRGAHFINLRSAGGERVTGLVLKRHLARFRAAGVDVPALSGHVVRLRGVRSATNPSLIPLNEAQQIEIVR